jgi:hypothetical protein
LLLLPIVIMLAAYHPSCTQPVHRFLQYKKLLLPHIRVARWHVFIPKIRIWVHFGGPWNEKSWYIIWPLRIYYRHLVYFGAIR